MKLLIDLERMFEEEDELSFLDIVSYNLVTQSDNETLINFMKKYYDNDFKGAKKVHETVEIINYFMNEELL